jgi:voltage-gated potassium channel
MLPVVHVSSVMPRRMRLWLRLLYARLSQLSWVTIGILAVTHFSLSYVLLRLSGEDVFYSFHTFCYFYLTTATTVGYGDLSPVSIPGRYAVTLFVMPGGISLFTTVIAKLAQAFADQWSMRMKGLGNYADKHGHIVILGWRGSRSERMLDLFRGDDTEQREMVLVAVREDNPAPGMLSFVRSSSLSDPQSLERAGARRADLIVAVGGDDNETLTAALSAGAMNPRAHLVAYFEQPSYAEILGQHCKNAESVVSMSMENTVRAAQDPGSFLVVSHLFSALRGPTQYRMQMPVEQSPVIFGDLFSRFKEEHEATILALRDPKGTLVLNPRSDHRVEPGSEIYYMADRRISDKAVRWFV